MDLCCLYKYNKTSQSKSITVIRECAEGCKIRPRAHLPTQRRKLRCGPEVDQETESEDPPTIVPAVSASKNTTFIGQNSKEKWKKKKSEM